MESKIQIRKRMLLQRREMSPESHCEKCKRIHHRLLTEQIFENSRNVLLYMAMPEEVSTRELMEEAFRQNKRVCLPVVMPGQHEMTLVWVSSPAVKMQKGPFGIQQPVFTKETEAFPEELDLVITPGLAFTAAGSRLGYGKGYFDRLFLRLKPECHRVALAFDFQILDALPQTDRDQPVHRIVTETGTTVCFDPGKRLDSI